MRSSRFTRFALASVSLALVCGLVGTARSQINASPAWVPMGVSQSGNSSTAWFHEGASRQVLACRAVEGQGGTIASVQCASGRMP